MIQSNFNRQPNGRLEVICGPMFSGKSEELIRRLRRAHIGKQNVITFKHTLDNRHSFESIASHSGQKIDAQAIDNPLSILHYVDQGNINVIGIDEVQFFPATIISVIEELVMRGKRVVTAGLDLDFRGIPFGSMPILLALADEVLKLKAICTACGAEAHFSQRFIDGKPAKYDDPIILIGAQEAYQPRCRECYVGDPRFSVMSKAKQCCL